MHCGLLVDGEVGVMLVHQSVLKGHHVILVLPLTVIVVVMVGEEGRLKLALSSL